MTKQIQGEPSKLQAPKTEKLQDKADIMEFIS